MLTTTFRSIENQEEKAPYKPFSVRKFELYNKLYKRLMAVSEGQPFLLYLTAR